MCNLRCPSSGGLDSLGAVEFVNSVGRRLGLSLPPTLVFDYPTTAAVVAYLSKKLARRQQPLQIQQWSLGSPEAASTQALGHDIMQAPNSHMGSLPAAKPSVYNGVTDNTSIVTQVSPPLRLGTCDSRQPGQRLMGIYGAVARQPLATWNDVAASGHLVHACDIVRPVPVTRWDGGLSSTTISRPGDGTNMGVFLSGLEAFDAEAFGMSKQVGVACLS
jgi:hypothetical protein